MIRAYLFVADAGKLMSASTVSKASELPSQSSSSLSLSAAVPPGNNKDNLFHSRSCCSHCNLQLDASTVF